MPQHEGSSGRGERRFVSCGPAGDTSTCGATLHTLVNGSTDDAPPVLGRRGPARGGVDVARLREVLSGAALVSLLIVPVLKLAEAVRLDDLALDFRQTFLPAAETLLDGRSPYPEYGYPPLVAFVSVPFALLPAPEVMATIAVAACVPAVLWLLGVRDWRCYVVAFLWVPVFNAVQTANVTLPLLLAAAVCWRWRDRSAVTASAAGLAVAGKILAWPLGAWLACTGRVRAAVGAAAVAVGVTFGLWATLGFSGLLTYGDSLETLEGTFGDRGYTFQALALDAGLSERVGLVAMLAVLGVVLVGVVYWGRTGDDARAFGCAVVGMIVASPIVWLHSFTFLLAPVALLRPRLSAIWFLPALLWFVSPGTGNGEPWQTVMTMATGAFVASWALLVPAPAGERLEVRPGSVRGRASEGAR